jgi:hypothetical protein
MVIQPSEKKDEKLPERTGSMRASAVQRTSSRNRPKVVVRFAARQVTFRCGDATF